MNRIQLLCVGKLKERYLRDACDEYIKRLSRFCRIEANEAGEYRTCQNPGQAEIQKALEIEGSEILNKITGQYVVAMCIEGITMDSKQLSVHMEQIAVSGKSSVTFIIGSSFGLSAQVKQRADLALSMSPMTFPHQLSRVMLLEQIYRAYTISSNAKYHK